MTILLFFRLLLLQVGALLSTNAFFIEWRRSWCGKPAWRAKQAGAPPNHYMADIPSEPEDSNFGRQDYWNQLYENQSNFSWYAGWEDLQPFVDELLEDKDSRVLLPGVGNDATLVDMYDDGYQHLTAMDYAPEGIKRCRDMLGNSRIRNKDNGHGVDLVVADARDLREVFDDGTFDAVIEKGTLDAIYLSGGKDKKKAAENLKMAISELGRSIKPGGIWISIAAVADGQIQASFDERSDQWDCLIEKGTLYITEDGYTSNNIDGSLLVWRKKK